MSTGLAPFPAIDLSLFIAVENLAYCSGTNKRYYFVPLLFLGCC